MPDTPRQTDHRCGNVWQMRCLDCTYNLRGCKTGACPECGRQFDPANPETYLSGLDADLSGSIPARRVAWWAAAVTWLYPLLLAGLLLLTWLIAWRDLGHPPQPLVDDPKFISSDVNVLSRLTWWVISAIPVAFFLGLIATLCACISHRLRVMRTVLYAALLIGVWVAVPVFLEWGPMRLLYWFMD